MRDVSINNEPFFVFQDVCSDLDRKIVFNDLMRVSEQNKRCVRLETERVHKNNFIVLNAAGIRELHGTADASGDGCVDVQTRKDVGAMQITIAEVGIRQDEQGRYCLNDLHQAAGAEAKHQPANWLRNKQAQELIDELAKIPQIRGIEVKQGLGTFVCKELVYAYAMWISAAFHLKVIRAYDAFVAGPTIPQTLPEALRLAADLAERNALLAPRAAIADRISLAEGMLSIRESAKVLKIKETHLVKWLVMHGWMYRDMKGRLRGYANKSPRFVSHKVTPMPCDEDSERVFVQVMITPEGLTKLASVFVAGF